MLFAPLRFAKEFNRMVALQATVWLATGVMLFCCVDLHGQTSAPANATEPRVNSRPNIVLIMSDDQGWGDVAYNGNPIVQTPNLDAMAREALRLDRFYAAAPVCSPTRASCLTGRHPYRYGVIWPNVYPLPASELTLAEALKAEGYRTGHFGKWHLGTMTADVTDGPLRMQRPLAEYSPPWNNGFDVCFSAEINGSTYNPMIWDRNHSKGGIMSRPVAFGETTAIPGVMSTEAYFGQEFAFWTGLGTTATTNLDGDSSKIIMDRAIDFIEKEAAAKTPFLAVVWFFAPHSPIAAGDSHRAPYQNLSMEEQHWYGSITAMDQQIGRLRERLRELNIADDTIVWFCSDNGPSWIHDYNSAGPFRGKKGMLYEGGIRVPALLEWPARFTEPRVIEAPISTNDFYPTLLSWAGVVVSEQPEPIDGIDVTPLLNGTTHERSEPIPFQSPSRIGAGWKMNPAPETRQLVLQGNRFKLISTNNGNSYELYDLIEDRGETTDIAADHPEVVNKMRAHLVAWVESCDRSRGAENNCQDSVVAGHGSPQVIGPSPNNEPSVVQLPDGVMKIFHMDEENEVCLSIASDDDGVTWSESHPEFIVPEETSYNTLSLLDAKGELHLFFLVRRGTGNRQLGVDLFYDVWHCRTSGGGKEWGEPKRVFAGYVGSIRSAVQLPSGRIVLPVGEWIGGRPTAPPHGANEIVVLYSDDDGDTWQQSPARLTTPVRQWGIGVGAVEPSVLELQNGTLWMLIRNDNGQLYQSFSPDGIDWTPPEPSRFASSESPSQILRLTDGRIILFWNNCLAAPTVGPDAYPHYSGRDAMHAAISEDDGLTWRGFREVFRDPFRDDPPPRRGDRGTAYPRAAETPGGYVILTSGQGEERRKIVRFHPDWLYEVNQEEDFSSGLENWHVFRSVGPVEYVWKNRVAGAQLVDHPTEPGEKALHLKKQDEEVPDGAVWNFPNGRTGRLEVRLMLPSDSGGAEISLLDRMVEPSADYESAARIFSLPIKFDGSTPFDAPVPPNQWCCLSFDWDLERQSCRVLVDDKHLGELRMLRSSENGISYLSLQSSSPTTNEVGFFVDKVVAHITEPVTPSQKLEPNTK